MGKEEIDIRFDSLLPEIKDFLKKRDIIDQETLTRFLDPSFVRLRKPDYHLMKVVEKIEEVISQQKKILIWGDEDMDGITATRLLSTAIQKIKGHEIETYIPSRKEEGYGLSEKGINLAIKKGIDIIITVDCGITSFKEVQYLLKKGLSVIITDHHEPRERLPEALILNPKLGSFGYKYLAGAGVAFKLADALFAHLMDKPTNQWIRDIPEIPILAMIGTLADRVPRLDENRIFFNEGAKLLEITKDPSLSFLREKGNIREAIEPLYSGAEDLTREFFSAVTKEKVGEIYSKLEAKHSYWSIKAGENFSSFRGQLSTKHLVLFDPDMDRDFAGTIANRAKDYTGHPVFVVYMIGDKIRGEGRGPFGFDLLSVLDSVSDLLVDYGGHKVACGFVLKNGKVEEFRRRVTPLLQRYEPNYHIDGRLKLKDITPELQTLILKMKPFGKGNRAPVFLIESVDYKMENNVALLSDKEDTLKLDSVKEMPPPSRRVNAYLRLDGKKIYLLKWEWTGKV